MNCIYHKHAARDVYLRLDVDLTRFEFLSDVSTIVMSCHFVLIHGANHGAWAWYKLQHRLQERGWRVTVMDMRSAGADTTDPRSITSLIDYSQPLLDFLHSLPPHHKVVLVGHSMGGLTLALAMEKYPHKIGLAVFVAALVLPSGKALADTPVNDMIFKFTILGRKCILRFDNGADKPPTLITIPTDSLQDIWYTPDVPKEDIVLASHLIKWFPLSVARTPVTFTEENRGQVPSVYIKYLKDQALPPRAQHYITDHHGPFSEVIEIDGGHFNFWPKVDDFTKLVLSLADKYVTRTFEA